MALKFSHTTLGQRVLFGAGQAAKHLAEEIERLEARRIMVIAASPEADIAREVTKEIDVALYYDDVVMHVPVEKAEKARAQAAEVKADVLVSVGGGSTTGLAKAMALTDRKSVVQERNVERERPRSGGEPH